MSLLKAIQKKTKALKKISKNGANIAAEILMKNDHIIIDMNTDDQLFNKGVDSTGDRIIASDPYSPFTVGIKKLKGQPTNRVTLKDVGNFHGSFKATKSGSNVVIGATDSKTKDLVDRYGKDIFGLIKENKEETRVSYIHPEVSNQISKALKL